MIAASRPSTLPCVSRPELLAAMADLHQEAVAAIVATGLPREAAEDSLGDIPRKVESYGELVDDRWLLKVFTGRVLTLGRLQVEREAGERGRSLHIPEKGPLDAAAVDASLAAVGARFGRAVPLVCESWVFDPRLDALPEGSNLRRFAARFDVEAAEPTEAGGRDLAKFVFRSTPERVLSEPLRDGASGVERIAYAALAADGRWSEPFAVLRR